MSSSSQPARPAYVSEQDLPTTSHESVFIPTFDNQPSSTTQECSNCNQPLPASTSTSTPPSSMTSSTKFPPSLSSSDSTDSLSDTSTKGGSQSGGEGSKKKNTSKPLIDTLLKKNAQWR